MAGSLYLGSQRVCPAIVSGGSPEPEPTEYFTFKFPDDMVEPPTQDYYLRLQVVREDQESLEPVCIDFNNIKIFSGNLATSQYDFEYVPLIAKVGNIEKLAGEGLKFLGNLCLAVDGYEDIDFDSLTEVGSGCLGYAFYNDEEKTFNNIRFPKLTKINSSSFVNFGNNGVDIYFNSLKSDSFLSNHALYYIGVGDDKTLHLPSNLSSVVPTLDGYPNFGGSNTTILYDLPATE